MRATLTIAEAEQLQIRARKLRSDAAKVSGSDPIFAQGMREKAHELEVAAGERLTLKNPPVTGPGNEFVVQGNLLTASAVVSTMKPDAIATEASLDRIDLVEGAQASNLALDLADSEKAKTSSEKLFAHRHAVAHKWAMELIAKASKMPLSALQMRVIKTAMDCIRTANDTAFKQAKLRGGAHQTFVVKHMNVAPGGQGIMGDVKAGRGQGRKRSKVGG